MPGTISDILGCASAVNTREPNDFYATPSECTRALIEAEGARLPARIWDPCCGNGSISVVLEQAGREVISTDLIDYGYGKGGIDFLTLETPLAKAIVTNPPFKDAVTMIEHAAAIGIEYLVFLHKASWMSADERGCMAVETWCPARVYVLQWRPDFKDQRAPTMECSWFVFVRRTPMTGISWPSTPMWTPEQKLKRARRRIPPKEEYQNGRKLTP
jgi:hypothetical protein